MLTLPLAVLGGAAGSSRGPAGLLARALRLLPALAHGMARALALAQA